MEFGKAPVYKYGPTTLDMRANGETIKQMAAGSFGMLMVMCMKVNGKTIRLMAMERILTSMVEK